MKIKPRFFYTTIFCAFLFAFTVNAEVIHVPDDYETIQGAINASEDGDEIQVAPGEYVENIDFTGKDISLIGNPDNPEEVVIDGNENGSVVTFANGESEDASISGFTIRNGTGTADEEVDEPAGGGVNCINSSPIISYCVIENNVCEGGRGAGIACRSSNPIIRHCIVQDNRAGWVGGGICLYEEASGRISETIIRNNYAFWLGCGMFISNSDVTIDGVLVCDNVVVPGGGYAVYAPRSNLTANNLTIVNNVSVNANCGSLACDGDVSIYSSILWNNDFEYTGDNINFSCIEGGADGEGNIDADPMFADPENGDYHLLRGSRCINNGDPDSPEDPDGTRADMGTFAFNYEGVETINVPDDFETIQEAINYSLDGDEIIVAPGEYVENIDFTGKNISVIGDPDNPEEVVIDGNENGSVVTFSNGESRDAVLSGFAIRNGTGTPHQHHGTLNGGGIYCFHSSPLISSCLISNNHTNSEGAGVYCEQSNAFIINCVISNNTSHNGAGISIRDNSNPVISRSLITQNETFSGPAGGIDVWDRSTPLIEFCSVTNNNPCAMMIKWGSHPRIANSVFWNNPPTEIVMHIGVAENTVTIEYSDLMGGPDEIQTNDWGEVIWGDGNIDADPLFVDPDAGNFHLTAESPCIDAGDPESPEDPDDTRADMGAYFYQNFSLDISLHENWNLISINVSPPEEFYEENDNRGPDVILMMAQLRIDEENHHVLLMKDEHGRFYLPAFDFNNIPYWDLTRGYQVKVNEDVEAVWSGEPIPANTEFWLNEGWNIVAYFPTYELDAESPDYYVLSPVIDVVEMAKNVDGLFLAPRFHFSNMPPWRETQGYYVKVSEDVLFQYPAEQEELDIMARDVKATRVHQTGNNMSILVNGLEFGQITALANDGRVVGTGTIDSDGRCGLAVWGDDESTDKKDGLEEYESFTLKYLDKDTELDVKAIHEGKGLIYTTNSFTVIDVAPKAEIPEEYYLDQNYPNPFNSTTRLTYGLPEAGHVSLKIYDISGRVVQTLVDMQLKAGNHTTEWNARKVSSGLYFLQLKASDQTFTQKVMLIR